jgi:diguanylate cyclase (GGDEF)-like protein
MRTPPRILIADDDRINLLILSKALMPEFAVVQTSDGAEALEHAARGDIDLILLDVMMPSIDGFEVCRRLKSNPSTSAIPVIFVTSLEHSVDEATGFAVGGVDYITKPIQPVIVRARVRTHVELKRSRDLLEQLASVDPLTGIANRRRFDAALLDEWRRARRAGRWLSLAIADVDHFKEFNDRHGHLVGDACLQAIAASLAKSARRAGDLVARYGGEEFGIILPDVEPSMMPNVLRTLLDGVSTHQRQNAVPGANGDEVTLSVGAVSVLPQAERDGNAALEREGVNALAVADSLLYEAKIAGRARAIHLDLSTNTKATLRPHASVQMTEGSR